MPNNPIPLYKESTNDPLKLTYLRFLTYPKAPELDIKDWGQLSLNPESGEILCIGAKYC